MLIASDSIARINDVPVEDIVAHYIDLKKAGAQYKGKCPFHDEKSPSFHVSPAKGIFKCFGCGEGGNGVNFVMKHQRLTWREAIEEIAKFSGIKLEYIQGDEPDYKERIQKQESLYSILEASAKKYHGNLSDRSRNFLTSRGYGDEEIKFWQLGYAPETGKFLQPILMEKGLLSQGQEAGIIKLKNGTTYDAFRDRIIYPIHDHRGRVVSLAGRIIDGDGPKYINGSDSSIYDKSKTLFGLFQNQKAIKNGRQAYIVEGYHDVISLCKSGVQNVVASCGTAFTPSQAKLLKRYTDKAVLFYDGDDAGIKAAIKALPILLHEGFNVFIVTNIPEGKDPDDLARELDIEVFLSKHVEDAITYLGQKIYDAADGPSGVAEARNTIAEIISYLPNDVYRDSYIQAICRQLKWKTGVMKKEVDLCINKRMVKAITNKPDAETVGNCFPRTEDQQVDFFRYGFWEEDEEKIGFGTYFATKNGNTRLSNFNIKSLFRIEGVDDSKRIFEIRNQWQTRIVDLPTESLSSVTRFTTRVESMGNFVFEGGQSQINKMKLKLYANEAQCKEIKNLGWQTDGFWAFANGIFDGQQWCDIDSFGIAENNDKKYFIAALSSIYSHDANAFISDKRFIHIKKSNVSFEQWSKLFVRVHGPTNGMLGILFFAAALFRDFIIHRMELFPHLFLFGQPATGKSQLARGMVSMFGKQQDVFNLNSGTNPGFFKKLGEFVNSLVFFDEYLNTLDEKRVQLLKSSADGVGHIKSESTKDERTISTPVRSSCLIAGQQLPNLDIALFTRCILLKFGQREFDIPAYNELKELEQGGLTTVTLELISLRDQVERNFNKQFDVLFKSMKEHLLDKRVTADDRLIRNYSVLLTMYEILSDNMKLPVGEQEMIRLTIQNLIEQHSQISRGNDVAVFWEYVEYLFTENIIKEGQHFRFADHLLYIRFGVIHKLYIKHYRTNTGKTGMDQSSLRDYLKNSPEWVKEVSSFRFTDEHGNSQQTSAYAFDYDKLGKVINLVRTKVDTTVPYPVAIPQPDSSPDQSLF